MHNNDNAKKIYFSRFVFDPNKGGGCRRAIQVTEIVKQVGVDFRPIYAHPGISRYHPINIFFGSLRKFPSMERLFKNIWFYKWNPDFRNACYGWFRASTYQARSISNEQISLAILDDPILCKPLEKKLKKKGIPYVSVVHNLESLGSNPKKKYKKSLMNKELKLLSRSELVITISREETFVLRNLGIRSYFLPYFPTETNLGRLLQIRRNRSQKTFHDFLLMGTTNNMPTLNGMVQFLSKWLEHGLDEGRKLIIAGFGTENLSPHIPAKDGIEFLGTLDNKSLDKLLTSVKACICYQEEASGALTRITELLIANVPVIANEHAARTYYNMPGVHVFQNFKELKWLLNNPNSLVDDCDIPLPEKPDGMILKEKLTAYGS